MRAFITGITGFAGGFLAEHLLASGDEVLGCSRRAEWPDWAEDDLRRVEVLKWDVGQGGVPDDGFAALTRFAPDCIYHLAALSVPSDCGTAEPTERAIQVNVRGTERVLDLAARLPRPPRVLFVSTSHVYARATKAQHRFDESAPTEPQRAYGKTKLLAEEAVCRAAARGGLDAVVVRAFQHTGPRQEPRLMLPEWAKQVAQPSKDPIRVKHLDTWVDLTDVRDVVRAYRLLAEHGQPGSGYNLGSGMATRTGDILDLLLKLGRSSRPIVELHAGAEKYDPIADIRRLQAATGWRRELSLETTVADTLAYWRKRPAERR
ncbi:MAG TPA: NAD-dependent epimerase/dehydratase family protein [Pirellulales bacterium]|jgi:GDP-4-dehydro-6-deoxy-D-mannose reductase|nr:NAD-dependent epimerase/dehydratase family protein [Pirellulales bacterium]